MSNFENLLSSLKTTTQPVLAIRFDEDMSDDEFDQFIQAIQPHKPNQLVLENVKLDSVRMKKLLQSLPNTLAVLSLTKASIDNTACHQLTTYLSNFSALQLLNLKDNTFNREGLMPLVYTLLGLKQLVQLAVGEAPLGADDDTRKNILQQLNQLLAQNKKCMAALKEAQTYYASIAPLTPQQFNTTHLQEIAKHMDVLGKLSQVNYPNAHQLLSLYLVKQQQWLVISLLSLRQPLQSTASASANTTARPASPPSTFFDTSELPLEDLSLGLNVGSSTITPGTKPT